MSDPVGTYDRSAEELAALYESVLRAGARGRAGPPSRTTVFYARILFGLGLAPFMLPPVITALGFLVFWVNLGLYGSILATLLSHAIFS